MTIKGIFAHVKIDKTITPVNQPPRKIPIHLQTAVENEILNMEAKGIIRRLRADEFSEWCSPITCVRKKNGGLRMCVDLRMANKAVVKESNPLPTIEELSVLMKDARYFTKLDVREAYHQLRVDEESSKIADFKTHLGRHRHRVLPFGLTTAPEIFRRAMADYVLHGLEGVVAISDDIMIWGPTREIHDERKAAVMRRLDDRNVRLREDKCEFEKNKVTFHGHEFSAEGIRPTQDKIDTLRRCQPPTSREELKSFLGLMSYVGYRYMPHLSTLTAPLRELLAKDVKYQWTKKQQEAFEQLKQGLDCIMTSAFFQSGEEVHLYADASPVGVGAVLLQKDQKQKTMKLIAFGSRGLTDSEKRYSQTEREALSLVWAVNHFDFYLRGMQFVLYTDHKPLLPIFQPKSARRTPGSRRLEYLALKLQEYDFTLRYCAGRNNIADPLSRLPFNETPNEEIVDEEYVWTIIQETTPEAITIKELRDQSRCDSTLIEIREALQSDTWKPELRNYEACKNELCFQDEVLLRGCKIVPPKSLRSKILMAGHEGHPGVVHMRERLRKKVWWPKMSEAIEKQVKTCLDCQMVSQTNPPEPMKRTQIPDKAWQHVAIDLMGPLPWGPWLLVVVCYYSRYFEVVRLTKISSSVVIEALREIFARWGIPEKMISDNGRQFTSEEFENYCATEGIALRHSTPYWPRMNGEVERQNRSLKKILQISYEKGTDWWADVQSFLSMQRNTPHSTTGRAPAELMMKRLLRDKVPSAQELEGDRDEDLFDKDQTSKERGKQQADKRSRARESSVDIGDTVLVKRIRRDNKLIPNYNSTPCTVVGREGGEVEVALPNGSTIKRNVSHVKRFDITGREQSTAEKQVETPESNDDEVEGAETESRFTPVVCSTPAHPSTRSSQFAGSKGNTRPNVPDVNPLEDNQHVDAAEMTGPALDVVARRNPPRIRQRPLRFQNTSDD